MRRREPVAVSFDEVNARDLWSYGIHSIEDQRELLSDLLDKAGGHPALAGAVQRALEATEEFVLWLKAQAPARTGPSGVGVENYDWYLANVQLLPYTWADEVTLAQRELARASYLIGKLEIDELLSARARQLGSAFTLRQAIDEIDAVGLIPVSLVRWELTGESGRVPGVGWPAKRP